MSETYLGIEGLVSAIIAGETINAPSFDHTPELLELNRRALTLSGGACERDAGGNLWLLVTRDGVLAAVDESDGAYSLGDFREHENSTAAPLLNEAGEHIGTAWLAATDRNDLGFDANTDVAYM